ncbi:MAG: tail fiber domain-containing protein, partial [Chitinophagia bacterium]|nr:tail fiber domain-containing protein [Chitinophagia bacterium]
GYNIPAPTGTTTTFLRNDGTWQTPSGSGLGTVTSVATGNGLTGGTITSTGTLAIDYTYAGTYTANQNINGANIGTFSTIPSVTSTGSTVGLGNSTNAVVLNGANWTGSGDGTNSLGSSGVRWDNLHLKTNLVWNSYTIPAPAGSTSTFLRNDGTWAAISGGSGTVTSVTAGSGLSGGTITTSGTISLNTSNSNTWSATQTFSSAVQTNTINANGGNITLASTVAVVPSVGFAPTVDGSYFLGGASLRWNTVYAVTGTINTSDENQKQDIRPLNEAELRVAVKLKGLIRAFKFKDAVTAKGDKARIHVGVIAQQVASAFESEGLDAAEYGLFCLDVLEDQTEQLGIRYDELLVFIISAL